MELVNAAPEIGSASSLLALSSGSARPKAGASPGRSNSIVC